MTKISFNAESIGFATYLPDSDVRSPGTGCAFKPVVVGDAGVEAIFKGLRLANIECLPRSRRGFPAKDIDS